MATSPHPLTQLSLAETDVARDIVLASHPGAAIYFRIVSLQEPAKADLIKFLDVEHAGKLSSSTPRPPRLAKVYYDAIDKGSKVPVYQEAIVDLDQKKGVQHQLISSEFHASLTVCV